MHTVYKYALAFIDSQDVVMPRHAKVLSAGIQGETLQIWALVDPDRDPDARHFRVHGTGHPVSGADELAFVDTVFIKGLAFHVFEDLSR